MYPEDEEYEAKVVVKNDKRLNIDDVFVLCNPKKFAVKLLSSLILWIDIMHINIEFLGRTHPLLTTNDFK